MRGAKACWIAASVSATLVILIVFALDFASRSSETETRRDRSAANLRRIGFAMVDYLLTHERVPGYIRSRDGTPLLSWRVALLPLLGESELFNQFRLDEPWDGPHNRSLIGW